jgi:hypothetical protein
VENIEIQLFGDLSLNGSFCDPQYYKQLKVCLNDLNSQIGKPDFRVVNWESPISTEFNFNPAKNPSLVTTVESAKLFVENFQINLACLGNNHIGDCKTEGLNTTMNFLENYQIDHYGASKILQAEPELKKISIKNKKFGFLSFVGSETNPKIDKNDSVFINEVDELSIVKQINKLKNTVDYIIVTLHWGIEYNLYPKMKQRQLAYNFIDAGANVIIGHHSHTLQGVEEYNNGLIFYSLGNFIFGGLKGKENIGWPPFCNNSGAYSLYFNSSNRIDFKFHPYKVTSIGLDSIDKEYNKNALTNQTKKCNIFKLHKNNYKILYKLNTLKIWLVLLPLFLIKAKGGFIAAIKHYFKPKYFNAIIQYFK